MAIQSPCYNVVRDFNLKYDTNASGYGLSVFYNDNYSVELDDESWEIIARDGSGIAIGESAASLRESLEKL